MEKGVLTVRDNEHNVADTVGGDEVARRTLPSLGKCAGKSRGARIRLAGPTFPRDGGTTNSIILSYKGYICILHINTNLFIYICYI